MEILKSTKNKLNRWKRILTEKKSFENSSSQKHIFFKGKILIIKSVFKLFKQHELDLRKVGFGYDLNLEFILLFYMCFTKNDFF